MALTHYAKASGGCRGRPRVIEILEPRSLKPLGFRYLPNPQWSLLPNAGFVDPGARTAHTLLLITDVYAGGSANLDRMAEMKALLCVRDEVEAALARAARALERNVERFREGKSTN